MASVNSTSQRLSTVVKPTIVQRPKIQTTFQLEGTIQPKGGKSINDVWNELQKTVLGTLKGKAPKELPTEAWAGADFLCSVPGHTLEGIVFQQESIWSVRLTHPDMPFKDQPATPGRVWTVDAGFKKNISDITMSVRLFCTDQPFCTVPAPYSRPRFIQYLSENFVLVIDKPIDSLPWIIQGNDDLAKLKQLITDKSRRLPVIMLTEADGEQIGTHVQKYLLDHANLARKLLGLAHVVCLPNEMSYLWTTMVGKTWSAFKGAVRTYYPGLEIENDDPREHPLAMPDYIMRYSDNGANAEEAFLNFLVNKTYSYAVMRTNIVGACPRFQETKNLRYRFELQQHTEDSEWKKIYEERINDLERQREELYSEYEQVVDKWGLLEKELEKKECERNALSSKVDALRNQLERRLGESVDDEVVFPNVYEDLPDWVQQNLAGRLCLHSRALQGIKKATFGEVQLVYQALLLLANEYRDMRMGKADACLNFDKKLTNLGLRNDLSISEERAGEEGDAYYVKYPNSSSPKRFLKHHLCKGSTKDNELCLRIYFFWDKENQQVVVGWLPSHLDIRST